MIPTHFSQLIGNSLAKSYLQLMLEKKTIAHSLLFAGPSGVGKSLFASALAAEIMQLHDPHGLHRQKIEKGHHPDLHIYRPEGKLGLHSLQSLRQLIEEVYMPPYEAPWKVIIIHEADRMLSYSANALLKTFEEPLAHTLIILLSHSSVALLPTILSRCRTIHFQALEQQEVKNFLCNKFQLEDDEAQKLAHLARGSLGRAVKLAEQKGDPYRHALLKILACQGQEHYQIFTRTIQELVSQVEQVKKQAEEQAKEVLYQGPVEDLSAHQQHLLEKELEAAVAMAQWQESQSLLETILFWYRDLHLLATKGPMPYLLHVDYKEQLEQALQKGKLLSLEKVQKMIEEARLALQRSVSLPICLENLLLKLLP